MESELTKEQKELKKVNEAHFKKRPNAVPFCMECDLKEKTYCKRCANKQLNRLGKYDRE